VGGVGTGAQRLRRPRRRPPPGPAAFSRRRGEIETVLAERGASSAKAAQAATLATRKAKDYAVTPDTLQRDWTDRAAAHGLDQERLAALLGRIGVPVVDQGWVARAAGDLAGSEGLTERSATIARRDVVRAWCQRLPAGADPAVIGVLTNRFLDPAAGRAVRLLPADAPPGNVVRRRDGRLVRGGLEARYSTPELLALERRTLDEATARRGDRVAVVDAGVVAGALRRPPSLTGEQAAMVTALTTGGAGGTWWSARPARARPSRWTPPATPGRPP
jgi:hypothetical protein